MFFGMYFKNPEAFLLLLFLPLALYLIRRAYKNNSAILSALKETHSTKKEYVFVAVAVVLAMSSLAAFVAKPQADVYEPVSGSSYGEYTFLVDTSRSMAARFSPDSENNLETSQQIMLDIVENLSASARYQVFGYSKLAFPLSSLSGNHDYIKDTVKNGLYINVIPERGSDIANALAVVASQKLHDSRYADVSHVVLFSDGQLTVGDAGRIREAIRLLQRAEISVVAVGIGSPQGQRIPEYDENGSFAGTYERTENGEIYVSYLQDRNLKIIAESTGGRYFHQSSSSDIIEYLKETLRESTAESTPEAELVGTKDYGWIPLTLFTLVLFGLLARAGKLY